MYHLCVTNALGMLAAKHRQPRLRQPPQSCDSPDGSLFRFLLPVCVGDEARTTGRGRGPHISGEMDGFSAGDGQSFHNPNCIWGIWIKCQVSQSHKAGRHFAVPSKSRQWQTVVKDSKETQLCTRRHIFHWPRLQRSSGPVALGRYHVHI